LRENSFWQGGKKIPRTQSVYVPLTARQSLKLLLSGTFIEGCTQTYQFRDTTEAAFVLFVRWMYSQNLENIGHNSITNHRYRRKSLLIRSWILAEQLLVPHLQNIIINLIEESRKRRNRLCTTLFKSVYENIIARSIF
jgi:hypothetical protein